MLVRAQQEKAYTVVGRIPFLNHKIDHEGMAIMVQGDSRLRRPYVVATAPAQRVGKEQSEAARQLANFLRSAETQEWISTFGIGLLDDQPLFFPVVIPKTPVTNGQRLLVRPELFTNHPRHEQIVTQKDGTTSSYAGIKLQDLLATVGAPQGEPLKGKNMDLVVVVEASDGYQAVFSLVELMAAPDGSQVLLADRCNGQPIAAPEGPYRLIVPHDPAHFRWVRMVRSLHLTHAGLPAP
jgi:DMSO/TMAO reductase YedYZ molybdopterin-dependent catalytic subunit